MHLSAPLLAPVLSASISCQTFQGCAAFSRQVPHRRALCNSAGPQGDAGAVRGELQGGARAYPVAALPLPLAPLCYCAQASLGAVNPNLQGVERQSMQRGCMGAVLGDPLAYVAVALTQGDVIGFFIHLPHVEKVKESTSPLPSLSLRPLPPYPRAAALFNLATLH